MKAILVIIVAVFAAAVLSTAALGLNASTVEAKCNPGRPNQLSGNPYGLWYDGWQNNASYISGVTAYIYNYSPWVQPVTPPLGGEPQSWVAAWSMLDLANHVHPNHLNYAQIGWVEFAYDVRYTFIQWATYDELHQVETTKTRYYAPAQTVGTYSQYEVLENYGTSYFEFWLNGSKLYQTAATFLPTVAQQSGEMSTAANQMPGGYNGGNSYEWYVLAQYQQYGNTWHDFNGALSRDTDNNWWNESTSWTSQLATWDNSCPD